MFGSFLQFIFYDFDLNVKRKQFEEKNLLCGIIEALTFLYFSFALVHHTIIFWLY